MNYKYLEDRWTNGYWDFIKTNLDDRCGWSNISKNPNITWEIIYNNSDTHWCWVSISENPNIT